MTHQADKKNLPTSTPGSSVPPGTFRSYAENLRAKRNESKDSEGCSEGHGSGHGHKLELIKDGDVVKKIIVRCQCGEVIEIDCGYT